MVVKGNKFSDLFDLYCSNTKIIVSTALAKKIELKCDWKDSNSSSGPKTYERFSRYFSGSLCLMSSKIEIEYIPVSSVKSDTSIEKLPETCRIDITLRTCFRNPRMDMTHITPVNSDVMY